MSWQCVIFTTSLLPMLKVVKAYEDSQAAAERLVAQEASPVVYVFSMFSEGETNAISSKLVLICVLVF